MSRILKKLKSRLRALLVLILYLSSKISSSIGKKSSTNNLGKTRIILFHHVDSYKKFKKIVKRTSRLYNCISFDDWLNGDVVKNKINIIIAFDDGYESWYTNAFPVLKEFSIKPLMFINSNFIDSTETSSFKFCKDKIGTWAENSLTVAQLLEMSEYGCQIGSHTANHIDMQKSNYEKCSVEITSDINNINKFLSFDVDLFAYPFGRVSDDALNAVKNTAINHAFCTESAFIEESKSKIMLKRTNVGMRHPLVVSAYIEGYLDRFNSSYQIFKKRIRRVI